MSEQGNSSGNGGGLRGVAGDDSDDPSDRRLSERIPVTLSVDYRNGDTFLFSYITNISIMGIFIRSEDPCLEGTILRLRFAPPTSDSFEMDGEVVWINPVRADGDNLNPGMGIRFVHLTPDMRERLVDLVRTIAYLHDREPEPGAS